MPLKSTERFPPGGWQFFEPATGWSAPFPMAESFDQTVERIINHRRANARFNLTVDRREVAQELEVWTCARLKSDPHWCNGVVEVKKKAPKGLSTVNAKPSRWSVALAKLAEGVRQVSGGVETLKDWLGDGGRPVSHDVAENRARVCGKCPLNQMHKGWFEDAKGEIADAIRDQTSLKNHAQLTTSLDSQLGTCEACGCHLPLKVWVPRKYILDNLTSEVAAKMDPGCWVNREVAQQLLVVIPYCEKDRQQAEDLVVWLGELGGCEEHKLLMVVDYSVGQRERESLRDYAAKVFKSVEILPMPVSTPKGWPAGPNAMWKATLKYVATVVRQPFYWMEPDCIPLKEGWLASLEAEYFGCGKPFMGAIVHSSGQPGVPGDHLTGCAVYPPNAHDILKHHYKDPRAFDMSIAPTVVPLTHHTTLHHHFWGQASLPPTFRAERSKDDPLNTLVIHGIPREAVLFHRNKDMSLVRLLREARR